MTGSPPISLETDWLDLMMPMHVQISRTGHIERVGPTIAKLRPDCDFVGVRFLEVFEFRRPLKSVQDMDQLRALAGATLRLQFRSEPRTPLKGILVPQGHAGSLLINLSFGISVVKAVHDYHLTNSDFAATDLTVEMLYMFEAKSAVMEESRNLNARLQQARDRAESRAQTDVLTGLKNRRAMDQSLQAATRGRSLFGLMHLDLDYFKEVNDTLGHAAGDFVLQRVAEILKEETRSCDTVARVGGDEFVLIVDRIVDPDDLMAIADRIVERLEQPLTFEGKPCRVSGSVGITASALYPDPDPDQMLSDADMALYSSKHQGRARATFVTPEVQDPADTAPEPEPETSRKAG